MQNDKIIVKGASEHNLKNIDVEIPRNTLTVITGISGSGKSSLAFDTIYAEGQRRYIESLSSYARQFLEQMQKPQVEHIEGLSPAISIEQRTVSKNPRSIVGTVTEIYDYLRVLYARIGQPHCPKCSKPISKQTPQQIVDSILQLPEGTKFIVLAPIVKDRKGEYTQLFSQIQKEGFVRIKVDGKMYDVGESIKLDKYKKHTIDIVVDRLVVSQDVKQRLTDSIELSLKKGESVVKIEVIEYPKKIGTDVNHLSLNSNSFLFSEKFACVDCGISLEELTPRVFSFNSPHGACPVCNGLGVKFEMDPDLIIPDKSKSLNEGVIECWERVTPKTMPKHKSGMYRWWYSRLETTAYHYGFSMNVPFNKLSKKAQNIILYGSGDEEIEFKHIFGHGGTYYGVRPFVGVIPDLERRYRETTSEEMREALSRYMSAHHCPACNGDRLKPEVLSVKIAGLNISQFTRFSVTETINFLNNLQLSKTQQYIAKDIIKEIKARLGFLVNVGLNYLTLDRTASTLSGGEGQRIRLATQIGSQLVGVLYILDEPSVGLHQRDNAKLLLTLKELRDIGNTVIVVEHDEQTIRSADYVIDLGPGAGIHGGNVVVCGAPEDIIRCPESITGKYLSGIYRIEIPEKRRLINLEKSLEIVSATQHNLKNIDIKIPLSVFSCITGVSGSGKSTLIYEILYKALAEKLYRSKDKPGTHKAIKGLKYIDKVINVDQSPIGRTPRSNPATYTGLFSFVRELFSALPESRARGYKPGRFSFNVKGGRCEYCKGNGIIRIEMHFLPDVYVQCEECKGERFNRETLEINYKGKNIADVLDMTIEEALEFFKNHPAIKRKLQTLYDVGMSYITLGQSATTFSGGEAQRIKLSRELSKRDTEKTIYILDEPTTGLHFDDVKKLLNVLNRLVNNGSTVVVIEHNLDVIKTADYIIDLGPEGGEEGGYVIAIGAPEDIARNNKSYTGHFLKKLLGC